MHVRRRLAAVVCLTSLVGLLPACRGSGIPEGDALQRLGQVGWGTDAVPPGQQWVLQLMHLKNVSDAPITIRSMEVQNLSPALAVRSIWLAPTSRPGEVVSEGSYTVFPPIEGTSDGGECVRQHVVPWRDRSLPADQESSDKIIVWLRAVQPGKAKLSGIEVTYTQGGELFRQVIDLTVEFKVSDDARPLRLPPDERRCRREVGPVEVLGALR